jgi:hypothetical protein
MGVTGGVLCPPLAGEALLFLWSFPGLLSVPGALSGHGANPLSGAKGINRFGQRMFGGAQASPLADGCHGALALSAVRPSRFPPGVRERRTVGTPGQWGDRPFDVWGEG